MRTKALVLPWLMVFSSYYSYKSMDRELSSFEQEERIKLIMADNKSKVRIVTYY